MYTFILTHFAESGQVGAGSDQVGVGSGQMDAGSGHVGAVSGRAASRRHFSPSVGKGRRALPFEGFVEGLTPY